MGLDVSYVDNIITFGLEWPTTNQNKTSTSIGTAMCCQGCRTTFTFWYFIRKYKINYFGKKIDTIY